MFAPAPEANWRMQCGGEGKQRSECSSELLNSLFKSHVSWRAIGGRSRGRPESFSQDYPCFRGFDTLLGSVFSNAGNVCFTGSSFEESRNY